MNLKSIFYAGTLTLLSLLNSACMQSAKVSNSAKVVPQKALCFDKHQLSNNISPPELWKSIHTCVSSEKYENALFENALFMYGIAGAFGRFDTLRVADETAHQAAKILPMMVWESLPKEKVDAFHAHTKQKWGDDAARKEYCVEIHRLGPPSYTPDYMIRHGMGSAQAYVSNFDAKQSWSQAVEDYLQCSLPQ